MGVSDAVVAQRPVHRVVGPSVPSRNVLVAVWLDEGETRRSKEGPGRSIQQNLGSADPRLEKRYFSIHRPV